LSTFTEHDEFLLQDSAHFIDWNHRCNVLHCVTWHWTRECVLCLGHPHHAPCIRILLELARQSVLLATPNDGKKSSFYNGFYSINRVLQKRRFLKIMLKWTWACFCATSFIQFVWFVTHLVMFCTIYEFHSNPLS
jgi:hypothetical protein